MHYIHTNTYIFPPQASFVSHCTYIHINENFGSVNFVKDRTLVWVQVKDGTVTIGGLL